MRTISEIVNDIRAVGVVPEGIDEEIFRLEKEIQDYFKKEEWNQCQNDHLSHMSKNL